MSALDIHQIYSNVQVYKGKRYYKKRLKTNSRVVAFDLDETLGSFTDLEVLWSTLQDFTNNHIPVNFNKLLDLYPEFLRYGILPILEYLLAKKQTGECSHLYIYTNNQCFIGWVDLISNYFNYALKSKRPVFNQIISAFKINCQRLHNILKIACLPCAPHDSEHCENSGAAQSDADPRCSSAARGARRSGVGERFVAEGRCRQ